MSNDIKKFEPAIWEFKTYDNRSWALTQRQYDFIKSRMEAGATVFEMPDGSLIAKGNMQSMPKRQMTMADAYDESKALPSGERKVNVDGPGFKKFVAAAKKLNPQFYKKKMREWGMDENGTYLDNGQDNKKGDTVEDEHKERS